MKYEIVRPPRSGALGGRPPEIIYCPRPGFTGEDQFSWRARSAAGESNVATVSIVCSASGVNTVPGAYDQSVRVSPGRPVTFALRYSDRDGPGPYRIFVVTPPASGSILGLDNDITYMPAEGFTGADSMVWQVGDGAGRSNRAGVSLVVR